MTDCGRVIVKTESVTLDEKTCRSIADAKPGQWICLSVSDTGPGIDRDVLPHIFEPFFTTKGVGKGTGLGLSVVYGVVKQHDGWIDVQIEPGVGTMFRVGFPVAKDDALGQIDNAVAQLDVRGSGGRILLIEDEEGVRKLAVRALTSKDYVVFEAADAKEAQRVFDREGGRFDLIFCDIVLPDQSGLELSDDLHSRGGGVPVLLTSGYTDRRIRWTAIREKGYEFLRKPYELVDLIHAVRDAIKAK
jgi:CheY-like chemotaxis protein